MPTLLKYTHLISGGRRLQRLLLKFERFFRRYKQRVTRMGCFMSPGGCDNFNAAWAVYINMEPYQVRRERKKHYRYPGLCPLEVGGASIQGLTWLDLLEV
jgi:hypothetical protein